VNPLFFNERIVRISSYTIRAIQNAIITGKSLGSFINALVALTNSLADKISRGIGESIKSAAATAAS